MRWILIISIFSFILIGGCWTESHLQTVHVTKQDIVRWCSNARAEMHPDEADYYCHKMQGDKYIAEGIQPNYDKYPRLDLEKK